MSHYTLTVVCGRGFPMTSPFIPLSIPSHLLSSPSIPPPSLHHPPSHPLPPTPSSIPSPCLHPTLHSPFSRELLLSTIWPHLTEEVVIDNSYHSDLTPLLAPVWTIRAKMTSFKGIAGRMLPCVQMCKTFAARSNPSMPYCVHVQVCACVRACMHACVCVCVHVTVLHPAL